MTSDAQEPVYSVHVCGSCGTPINEDTGECRCS